MKETKVIKGLVLSERQHKEYNSFITVLSASKGLISIYCYGSCSPKNKNFAPTKPFTYSEFELEPSLDGTYTLKSASVINAFSPQSRGLTYSALGMYLMELLMSCASEDQDESEMLRLGLNILYALHEGKRDPRLIKLVLEIKLSAVLGMEPYLSGECVECGNKTEGFFDYESGGLMCGECIAQRAKESPQFSRPEGIYLDGISLAAYNYLISCDQKKMLSLELSESVKDTLGTASEKYLLTKLDRKYQTLGFYKQVVNMNN